MLAELVIAGSLVVVDGDSLRMGAERIRVLGVDAPEIACRCEAECRRAWAAKEFVQRALANARVDIERAGKDTYGRTLAHVYVNGRDLGEMLIAAGLGRPYHGERRQSWCERN